MRDQPLCERYPEFKYKIESTGAMISLDNAVSFLFLFCQSSQECKSYGLVPEFELHDHDSKPPTFSCTLTLPSVFNIEPLTTERFINKALSQCVAAYMAVVRLHQEGMIDDNLNPVRDEALLRTFPDFRPEVMRLPDSTIIPSPIYKTMGLDSLIHEDDATLDSYNVMDVDCDFPSPPPIHDLIMYRLPDFDRIALVTKKPLPRAANMPLNLANSEGIALEMRDEDMQNLLSFHSTMCHLAMHGWQSFSPSFPGLHIEKASQAVNLTRDKGYLLIPLAKETGEIDWAVLNEAKKSDSPFVHTTLWPLPPQVVESVTDCLIITHPKDRHRPRMYELEAVSEETMEERFKAWDEAAALRALEAADDDEDEDEDLPPDAFEYKVRAQKRKAEAAERELKKKIALEDGRIEPVVEETLCSDNEAKKEGQDETFTNGNSRQSPVNGENTIEKKPTSDAMDVEAEKQPVEGKEEGEERKRRIRLVPSYTRTFWSTAADVKQPLLVAHKFVHSIYIFKDTLVPKERDENHKGPRSAQRRVVMVAPQFCSLIAVPVGVMRDCQRMMPYLYQLEGALKVHQLIKYIGLPVNDVNIIRTAITKPEYERLEVLGDCHLKLVMGQYVLQSEPIITKEDLLHTYRSNLVSAVLGIGLITSASILHHPLYCLLFPRYAISACCTWRTRKGWQHSLISRRLSSLSHSAIGPLHLPPPLRLYLPCISRRSQMLSNRCLAPF